MDKYLLDTNIFINAYRQYFPIDFCPAFWSFLEKLNQKGEVYNIENVWSEIARGSDQDMLKAWAKEHKLICKRSCLNYGVIFKWLG
mgnify:CR=1 FL=1